MQHSELKFSMTNRDLSLYDRYRAEHSGLSDAAAVRAICEELLDDGEVEPPVDVGLLASLRGITSVRRSLQTPAGMLVNEPSGLSVIVRSTDGHERQRFTVLHEAGHTLFPGYQDATRYRCKGPKDREEQLCDIAASELLLPRRFFVPDLADVDFGMGSVEGLASLYEASIESTALRVVTLWPARAMLLVFSVCHQPADANRLTSVEPKLRLNYASGSGPWPFARRHKSVSENSPVGRAMKGENVDETGSLREIFGSDQPLRISARRYGVAVPRVFALITPVVPGRPV